MTPAGQSAILTITSGYDWRRHGWSSQPSNGNEMDSYVDDLAAFIGA